MQTTRNTGYLPGLAAGTSYSRCAALLIIPSRKSWLAGGRRLPCVLAALDRSDPDNGPLTVETSEPVGPPGVASLPVGACVNTSDTGRQAVPCGKEHTHTVIGNVETAADEQTQAAVCIGTAASHLDAARHRQTTATTARRRRHGSGRPRRHPVPARHMT